MTIAALEQAYADLARGEAVCRPRIDIRIPTSDPSRCYQWGTMEGGSTAGYFAIRMKSDLVLEQTYEGVRTQEKYCGEPGQLLRLRVPVRDRDRIAGGDAQRWLPSARTGRRRRRDRDAAHGAGRCPCARHARLRRHGAFARSGARHRAPHRTPAGVQPDTRPSRAFRARSRRALRHRRTRRRRSARRLSRRGHSGGMHRFRSARDPR